MKCEGWWQMKRERANLKVRAEEEDGDVTVIGLRGRGELRVLDRVTGLRM